MNVIAIPNDIHPSELWADAERRFLIGYLSDSLRNYVQGKAIVESELVYRTCERISFLATAPTAFLEANRPGILGLD